MAKGRKNTERESEKNFSAGTFTLQIPKPVKSSKEQLTVPEKTSLYVPTNLIVNERNGFKKSAFSDQVLISSDISSVLSSIFKYGDIGKRYGDCGLETDITKQQIIVYAAVVCQGNILMYQRASAEDKKIKKGKFMGDSRLQGELSVGFGGHKTKEDILFSREELIFLKDLLPGVRNEVGTMLGLNHGLFSEVQEEVGLGRDDISDLTLLGAFYGKWIDDPLLPVQVHWVHTCIAAVVEVNPYVANYLTFRSSEVAKAWWIPLKNIEHELDKRQIIWKNGKGPRVERWTEVMIREFIPKYLSLKKSSKITSA